MPRRWTLALLAAAICAAHPAGNGSLNHYTRIEPSSSGVRVLYVLDLAEAASYDFAKDPASALKQPWLDHLVFRSHGRDLKPRLLSNKATARPGVDGLTCIRLEYELAIDASAALDFEDHNEVSRRGWKEIVVRAGPGVGITRASHGPADRTVALTQYPADMSNPPSDLRAHVEWTAGPPVETVITPLAVPPTPPPPATDHEKEPPQHDFLAALLGRRELTLWMILTGFGAAMVLGAAHAFTPGHGKTMVAAYLVGSRGDVRHAFLLGAAITFTHTASVFAMGLVTLFLTRYIVPDRLIRILELISGVAIVIVGAWLLYQRLHAALHHHHHHHGHSHGHHHQHDHDHREIGSLIALGASGGLVPCPSALVLMLSAIAVGRTAFGLLLMVFFSLGLASVLTAIGVFVVYARHALPDSHKAAHHPVLRWLPVASAAIILIIGLVMTVLAVTGPQSLLSAR